VSLNTSFDLDSEKLIMTHMIGQKPVRGQRREEVGKKKVTIRSM
jgi:hypothetical protein